jgi:DNA-binding beta-propeller fold protein YncE
MRIFPTGEPANRLILILVFALLIRGCGEVGTGPPASGSTAATTATTPSLGRLYIANTGGGDLLFYDQAVRVVGNVPPSGRLPPGLVNPVGVFLDRANDRLFVADAAQGAILIFEPASLTTTPARILSGVHTQINQPFGVFVDTARNLLYVANANLGTVCVDQPLPCRFPDGKPGFVLIFENASTIQGDTAPTRALTGDRTTLGFPRAVFVDTVRDLLYVSNAVTNSILVFENASARDGNVEPDRVFQPPVPLREEDPDNPCGQDLNCLSLPFGIFVDPLDRLYVTNTGRNQSSILVFENASAKSGSPKPDKVLAGNLTLVADPIGIDYDSSTDTLYVTNLGDVSIKELILASGRSTGSNTSNTLNDTNASYSPNEWAGRTLQLTGGSGAGQSATILSNTATQFTINGAWAQSTDPNALPQLPDDTTLYQVIETIVPETPAPLDSFVGFSNFNANCTVSNSPCAIAPDIILRTPFELSNPAGVAVDPSGDRIYIATGLFGASGQATGGTATTLTNLNAAYTVDQWVGQTLTLFGGTGAGQSRTILSNDATTFTVATWDTIPDATSLYQVSGTSPRAQVTAYTLSNLSGPSKALTGEGPLFGNVASVALDSGRDILYAANRGEDTLSDDAVLALLSASSAQPGGSLSTLLGSSSNLNNPQGIAVDAANDLLYVANGAVGGSDANKIQVYGSASGLAGNAAPIRSLSASVNDPRGLSLDQTDDTLYVANFGGRNILAFSQASSASPASPRIIGTNLGSPVAVAIDPVRNRLYVGLSKEVSPAVTGTILVFDGASGLDSSSVPSHVVGALPGDPDNAPPYFTFNDPTALYLDAQNDILYVVDADGNALHAFEGASRLSETSFPTRILVGVQTGLNRPTGIAVLPP